jgi:hypothetical protein
MGPRGPVPLKTSHQTTIAAADPGVPAKKKSGRFLRVVLLRTGAALGLALFSWLLTEGTPITPI